MLGYCEETGLRDYSVTLSEPLYSLADLVYFAGNIVVQYHWPILHEEAVLLNFVYS